jgi:hypothetical protein
MRRLRLILLSLAVAAPLAVGAPTPASAFTLHAGLDCGLVAFRDYTGPWDSYQGVLSGGPYTTPGPNGRLDCEVRRNGTVVASASTTGVAGEVILDALNFWFFADDTDVFSVCSTISWDNMNVPWEGREVHRHCDYATRAEVPNPVIAQHLIFESPDSYPPV